MDVKQTGFFRDERGFFLESLVKRYRDAGIAILSPR
jgi:hypothetical protein